ncbi:hypothetical protein AM629_13165 [Photorhabdus heterorhabditis]|uniref:Conjugal transfer protein TraP n=1 Tax=Photorhabdus heterorhabditis TaxID=880156 RepID=A0ABR5KAX4_9GAMM|nr:hypothetical protein [Photorhabdus heterorhabditis]KOY61569.1 hypothetical protein AM629_13165 [Photorhabdus heterorhabditis]
MSSRFDLDTPPTKPLPEDADVDIPSTPQKTNGPKLITLPMGIKVTVMQLWMMVTMLLGLVIFVFVRDTPQQTSNTPQFASQEPVAEQPISSFAETLPSHSVSQEQETSATVISENIPTNGENGAITEDINNLRTYSENNREGIKALDQRLRTLEQQFAALQQHQSASLSSVAPTTAKPTTKKTHQAGSKKSNFQGASIASLYPGLAWVNYKGSTWALRQGDRIGNATVQTIDTHKREVVTTAGIIR